MKGLEQTLGETCSAKLATISTSRDPKGRFTKAPAAAPGASKPKPADPAKKAAAPPAQEQTPDQDQDEDSSEYESSSEEETPGPVPRNTQTPSNPQAPEESETPEHQDPEESPDQEQLHQEGAPKPHPEQQDPETLEPAGPAHPASPVNHLPDAQAQAKNLHCPLQNHRHRQAQDPPLCLFNQKAVTAPNG